MPVHVRYADNVVNSRLEHTFLLIIKSLKWHAVYITVAKHKCVFVWRKDYFLASKKRKKKKRRKKKKKEEEKKKKKKKRAAFVSFYAH